MDLIAYRTRSRKRNHSQMDGKISEENAANLDIIACFPRLVCEHVFQHLDAKELLAMSTVNKQWNKFVGERPQVRKLKLVIGQTERMLTRKVKNILEKSNRQYQNVKISVSSKHKEWLLQFFAEREGFWKSVELNICGPFAQVWPKLLNILEPSIELLVINDSFRPQEPSAVATNWTFPRLKRFQYNGGHSELLKYFVRVTSLVGFSWCDHPYFVNRQTMKPNIHAILRNNNNLKDLHIATDWNFFDQLPETKFKLQTLSFDINSVIVSTSSFCSFLKPQSQTLETLNIDLEPDQALLDLVFRMPKLTSLNTGTVFGELRDLPRNSTITSLEVCNEIRMAEIVMLRALPNLKHFKCFIMNEESLFLLGQENPALESFEANHFIVSNFPGGRIFPKIKKVKAENYYGQPPTSNSKFAKLVKKDMERSRNMDR